MTEEVTKQSLGVRNAFSEIGVAGAKVASGYVYEEFLPALRGRRGIRVYREMRDNSATVGSILFAIEMLLRAVEWRIEVNDNDDVPATRADADIDPMASGRPTDEEAAAEWLEGVLFDDMSHTWEDFISNVLTMITFGWQWAEVVYKRRLGPDNRNPMMRSNYNDGTIGIRKLADRAQDTLDR